MAGVSGDYAKLHKLIRTVEGLKRPAFRAELNKQFAHETLSLVQDCFIRERGPYGHRWQPLKKRRGKILRDKGRLFASIRVRSNAREFSVATNVKYAAIHNFGGPIKHAARTELRAYAESRSGKRKRVDLYSRRARVVRTAVNVRAYNTRMPKRQFIPESGSIPPAWAEKLRKIAQATMQGELGL